MDALGQGVEGFAVGDRVAFLSNHAYAEHDVVSTDQAVRLPASLHGVPFPGEPLGCAMNIFERSHIKAGDTVAIVGIGFLGALLTRLCANAGARVVAIARKDEALAIARTMGAAETVRMDDHWAVVGRVKELTEGKGGDVVIEAVGKQGPLDLATDLVREMGRLVIAGYHQDGPAQREPAGLELEGLGGDQRPRARGRAIPFAGIRAAVAAVETGRTGPHASLHPPFRAGRPRRPPWT